MDIITVVMPIQHPQSTSQSLPQTQPLDHLDAPQLRELVASLMGTLTRQNASLATQRAQLAARDREIAFKQAVIDKITHEMAVLKRLKFAAKSEHYNPEQKSLLEETIDADIAALEQELAQLVPVACTAPEARAPKRQPLPAHLPRTAFHHEPHSTICGCGCQLMRIGEDVAEKLDYVPGVFTVERHIRGKWVCKQCETLVQAPVAAHIIDKGIPTTGLLAQVLVAKYADHLPLYRQETIFGRAGMSLPRSTLAQWVGACGVQLQPLVDALKSEMPAVVKAVVAWVEDQAACRLEGLVSLIGLSGLRWTTSMRVQFRVFPDHRLGCRMRAAAYTATRLLNRDRSICE